MKISFAICTHNEEHYISQLLLKLTDFIEFDKSGVEYEIVILDDYSDQPTCDILEKFNRHSYVRICERITDDGVPIKLSNERDYATHKNYLNSKCTGDWILNLDADELVEDDLLGILPTLIDNNPEIEMYWVPRINTVDGLTLKHVQQWGWVLTTSENHRAVKVLNRDDAEYKLLDEYKFIISQEDNVVTYYKPIICWPDLQTRFYKNDSRIKWTSAVHERLVGYTKFGILPQTESLAILHHKEIKRQEEQNTLYNTIRR